jgi:hypothetical protein
MDMTKRKSYDKSVIKKLDAADWSSMMLGLIKYARAKEKVLISVYSDLIYTDLIKEAIARVYGQGAIGKFRNWDSDKYPDLSLFMKYIIKDVVREEVSRLTGYKTQQLFWENDPEEERFFKSSAIDESDAHQYFSPESLILEQEKEIFEDELSKKIRETVDEIEQGDEDLAIMLISIKDGNTKSAKIAEDTGFDINKVYYLRKRLKRHFKWLRKKYEINTTI